MKNIKHLYQDMIIEHNRNPRHFKPLDNATHIAHGKNPLCGDDYYMFIKVSDNKIIEDIGFHGTGCAISKSSGSLLTTSLIGKSVSEAESLKDLFLKLLTTDSCSSSDYDSLGKLMVFEGVKEFPIRVKCATLLWRACEEALHHDSGIITNVSTE